MIRNVFTIALKDLSILWTDKFGLFWVLGFPLIMAIMFGSIFGGGGGGGVMSIAIVDLDDTQASRQFADTLESMDALKVWRPSHGNQSVEVTQAMAHEEVRLGRLTGYIVIPQGYASDGFFGGLGSKLSVGIDPSRQAEAGYLQGLLVKATFLNMQDVFTDPEAMLAQIDKTSAELETWDIDPGQRTMFRGFFSALRALAQDMDRDTPIEKQPLADAADAQSSEAFANADAADEMGFGPVQIEMNPVVRDGVGPRSSFEVSFPQAMVWAVIGACATFALSLVRERKQGTLLRLRIAPHPTGVILAGKGLACFTTVVGSLAALTLIGHLAFDVQIGSVILYGIGIVCIGLCFVGIMMAITTLGTTEEAVGGAGWGILITFTMIGGGTVPLMFMPHWLVGFSKLSPVRWSVWVMEGSIWRGLSFAELLPAFGVLVGIGVASFAFGVWVFNRREA